MNRRSLILAGLAALPAATLVAPVDAQRRRAARKAAGRKLGNRVTASASRFKIVTRTFTSTAPVTFRSGGTALTYPTTIPVRGFTQGRTLKVRVTLIGLSPERPGDLDIMVVAPGNIGAILMSDVGDTTAVSGISLTFDQEAPARLPDVLTSGTFQPANLENALDEFSSPAPAGVSGHSLAVFNNRNPNGLWQLFIFDDFPLGGGSLGGWSVTIRARIRVPAPRRRRATRRTKE